MKSKEIIIDGVFGIWHPEIVEHEDTASKWTKAMLDLESDKPTGAWGMSNKTAKAQVNMQGGRNASSAVVSINWRRMPSAYYVEDVSMAAGEREIPVALLLAIFCRESNQGHSLDRNGEGDRGYAFGVGQVDKRYHRQDGRPDPYSLEHMRQSAQILSNYRAQVAHKHPSWDDKYVLKGAAVAYNSGVSNVQTIERMDRGTTGHDYGADVLARAQFYYERGVK